MNMMNNSEKAYVWAAMNYAEGTPAAEKLAVRFKNEDLGRSYRAAIDGVIEKLQASPGLQPEQD
jgi:hypothetical protein